MISQTLLNLRRTLLAYIDANPKLELHLDSKSAAFVVDTLDDMAALTCEIDEMFIPEHMKQPEAIERGNVVILDRFRQQKPKGSGTL